ncbi:hypothetical protein F5148DRAFT_485174 [Russula earlei]|uniref:Uncharacterized protein n=1 Tax=Russula earlei TaxID=71964 RepID=A0ACC0TZD1_9AGAM|nr:hypothetical protein F5148DRAFT_485174 [Russula earlei]
MASTIAARASDVVTAALLACVVLRTETLAFVPSAVGLNLPSSRYRLAVPLAVLFQRICRARLIAFGSVPLWQRPRRQPTPRHHVRAGLNKFAKIGVVVY